MKLKWKEESDAYTGGTEYFAMLAQVGLHLREYSPFYDSRDIPEKVNRSAYPPRSVIYTYRLFGSDTNDKTQLLDSGAFIVPYPTSGDPSYAPIKMLEVAKERLIEMARNLPGAKRTRRVLDKPEDEAMQALVKLIHDEIVEQYAQYAAMQKRAPGLYDEPTIGVRHLIDEFDQRYISHDELRAFWSVQSKDRKRAAVESALRALVKDGRLVRSLGLDRHTGREVHCYEPRARTR